VSPLTYAIGDIHGCRDLLVELLGKIRDHAAGRKHRVVFLGDYIDRGPDSAGVVATVMDLQARSRDHVVCLKGNHEDLLLTAVADPGKASWWLENGGDVAMASFEVKTPGAIPQRVLDWMAGLPTLWEDDRRYFVHAGFVPGFPVARQSDRDKLWIREPFLSVDYDFGKHVVHGHTPVPSGRPELRPYRTNLDTAAVFGHALTAGIFDDARAAPIGFLQAKSARPAFR
jgi:serine/threonine protein phosphatase 1